MRSQRYLVSFQLVTLRLYGDVTQLLLLPQPVHAVEDAASAFHVLRVVAAAVAARVIEAGGATVLRAQHRRTRRPELAAAHTRATRTAVDAWTRGGEAVERPDIGTVQLPDYLLTGRRTDRTPAATAHGCGKTDRPTPLRQSSSILRSVTLNFSDMLLLVPINKSLAKVYRDIRLHRLSFN